MIKSYKFAMMNAFIFIALFLFIIASASSVYAEKKPNVIVSISPQKILVSEIGAEFFDVTVMVGPGQSPATYEPTPNQLVALSSADIYFRIGVPFENRLMSKIEKMFPDLKIVDCRDGIKLREISGHEHDGHYHHDAEDPHIWMDPILFKTQAETICEALSVILPSKAEILKSNLENFQSQLDHIHRSTQDILKDCPNNEFLIFHPTLGYFADRYGLVQHPIEYEGKEPGAKYIAELITLANEKKIEMIFTQPQFTDKGAKIIGKAINAKVYEIDHLPGSFVGYLHNLSLIVEILSGTGPKKMP